MRRTHTISSLAHFLINDHFKVMIGHFKIMSKQSPLLKIIIDPFKIVSDHSNTIRSDYRKTISDLGL